MKGKRWSTQEKPGKGWMGRPKRLRLSASGHPPVIRRTKTPA